MVRRLLDRTFSAANVLVLALLALLSLYPFVHTFSLSISTAAEANQPGLRLFPRQVTWTAYEMVLSNPQVLTGYANTLFRTIAGTALTLFLTCLLAYPLSRRDMPHRRKATFYVMFTLLFSAGIVPNYLLIRSLGLIDSRLVYILPVALTAFNVIVVRNFFRAIPESLGEAARVEGAGEWHILWRIYVPLSSPILATVALWTAVLHWNQWFDAMLFITDDGKQVLQTWLQRIVIENSIEMVQRGISNPDPTAFTPDTIKAATVVITVVPILVLYPFLQRFFVSGLTLGGVKE